MDFPDAKALKKLAKACREAGIKSYKGNGIELTFSDEVQAPAPKRSKATSEAPSVDKPFESDELSQEALLFWSVGDITAAASDGETQ